jgi:hypothetical protein
MEKISSNWSHGSFTPEKLFQVAFSAGSKRGRVEKNGPAAQLQRRARSMLLFFIFSYR